MTASQDPDVPRSPASDRSQAEGAHPAPHAEWHASAWTASGMALAALAGGAVQTWQPELWLQLATVAAAGLCGWLLTIWILKRHDARTKSGHGPALELPQQVVPVWKRSLAAAKDDAERSANSLAENFASVLERLENALSQNADLGILELGVADRLMEERRAEIDTLLVTTRQAVAMKDKMLGTLTGISQALSQMESFSRQVQEIGRATNLMSLNASVEATRAGNSGSGFGVVATEVRRLAAQSRVAATQVGKLVHGLQEQLDALRLQARRMDTDDEELLLKAEENARSVIRGMLDSLSQTNSTSRTLRDTGRQVQGDIERIMMSLQSHDRVGQMLVAVCDDMERMNQWLGGADDPHAELPTLWLDRLAQHYTMEDQHSIHHNAVRVERTAAVEFF